MIRFKIENKKALRPLNKNWWTPTKVEWIPELLNDNKPYWNAQTTAEGRPWAPLSPRTPKSPGGKILRRTGRMLDTVSLRSQGIGIEVDTTFYGPFHQFGTSKMVARPWMGVPQSALDKLPGIAWKNILK